MDFNKKQHLLDNIEAPRRLSAADREAGGAMVEQLQKMGIGVHTDNHENRRVLKSAEQDNSEAGKVRHMKTENGESYGFAYKGEMYLDPRKVDAELPLHEYAHLWCQAFRRINPDGWQKIVDTMCFNEYETWDYISKLYPNLSTDSEVAEEVIAHYSGKHGAEKLHAELQRMTPRDADYGSRWGNIYKNISKAIQDFWKHIGDSFNIEYKNADDVADMILKDFCQKVSPVKKLENWLQERDKAYADAVAAGDMEQARDILAAAIMESSGNGVTPFVSVGGYRGKLDYLARNVKSDNVLVKMEAINEAADKMAPMVGAFAPDKAVLVPAPSHKGMATDMLALAHAIGNRTGMDVCDVLKSDPRQSQYEAKKETGQPLTVEQLGIRKEGELPEGKLPIIVDNVVNSGNTAEACVKALGGGLVLCVASAVSQERHAASLKSGATVAFDRNGQLIPLSERFELRNKWLGKPMNYKPDAQPVVIAGLERYSEQEIEKYVREHFEAMLEGSDIDASIVGIKVIGSRVNGDSSEDSDLDVLLEFEGHASEDGLFNILNDEEEGRLYIEGIPVDINPITAAKSGTIEEFLERNGDYRKNQEKNNNVRDMEDNKTVKNGAGVVLDIVTTGEGAQLSHAVKMRGDNINVELLGHLEKVSPEDIVRMAVAYGGETRQEDGVRSITFPSLDDAQRFTSRVGYWEKVRQDETHEGMAADILMNHMAYVTAGAYGVTRVMKDMQPNPLAENILKLWHGDRSVLNGLSLRDYFTETFHQLNDLDAPLHKEIRRQWDDLEKYSGGNLRQAAWMMAYAIENEQVECILNMQDLHAALSNEQATNHVDKESVTVSDDNESVTVKGLYGVETNYRRISGWTHDDPALIYSNTEVSVYFYDSEKHTVEDIENEAGIDAYENRQGFFLVLADQYNEAYWQLKEHDINEGFEEKPLNVQEMSLMSQYVQDQATGNHLLGRPRPEGYKEFLLEMAQTHEALWDMRLLNERQRSLLIAESLQYHGGVGELADELNVDRDYLVDLFVGGEAAKTAVSGEKQLVSFLRKHFDGMEGVIRFEKSLTFMDSEGQPFDVTGIELPDMDMDTYSVQMQDGRNKEFGDYDYEEVHTFGHYEELLAAVIEHKIILDYQKEDAQDLPMFLMRPVNYTYNDNEGQEVVENLTAYAVYDGMVMLYQGMDDANKRLSPTMLSDLPLADRLEVGREILSNLQKSEFKEVAAEVTPQSERIAFMEGVFAKYDRQTADLEGILGDFQTMKETPDIWINGMYEYMTGEERKQFLDLVEKDDTINEISKAAITSRRFLLNGEMDASEFRLQEFLLKTFSNEEDFELNFNIPLHLTDADGKPFEANGIKSTEVDGQPVYVVEVGRDRELPLHTFGHYDDLHRRVLAELILDTLQYVDAEGHNQFIDQDVLDAVNVAPKGSQVKDVMEGLSVADGYILQVRFIDEQHSVEGRVVSGQQLVEELDVPFLTALFGTTQKLNKIAQEAANELKEEQAQSAKPEKQVVVDIAPVPVPRLYSITYGTFPGLNNIYGDVHVDFGQNINAVGFKEFKQIAEEMGGDARTTYQHEWADFSREEDAVRFAEKIVALNQERVDAQQNRLDFRIAQMAPIFPVPANENVPVRYGIHGYQWRSGDEDYDTDMSYFVNEYKKLNRDKVKFVYGYKFGFLFFDQKDALEFHKLMSDYVKAIGRGDVLNRLDYETKKQFLMDNIVGGPTEQEFAHGQYRLAEGTYMKEADGSDTKLSEREWLKASVAQPERFHFVSAAHDIIDASIESIDVWGLAKGVKPDGSAVDPESTDRIEGYVKADKLFELVPGLKDVSVLQNEDLQGAFCATEPDGNTVYIDNDVMWDARLGDATAQEELKESLVIGMKNYLGAHQIADSQIEALKPSDEIIRRGDYIRRPVRFHFVGVKGATNLDVNLGDNNISFLQHAKNLEGLGRMPESIKLDTGWEKGADGQWRLEIPAPRLFDPFANVQWMKEHPEVMRWRELNQKEIASALEMGEDLPVSEQQELQQLRERDDVKAFKPMTNMKNPDRLTVKDYIDAPDLFAAYPEVADIPVKISILEDGQFAHLHIEEDILALEDNDRKYTIEISSEVANKAWGLSVAGRQQMFDSVVHEIQHYVQEVEGFALGVNEEMFSDKKTDVLRDINFVTDDHLFEERAGMGVNIRNAEDIRIQMDKRIGGHPISYYYADKLDTVARKYGFEGYSKLLEGFDNLPTRFQQYAYTAGEVEARNVVTRMRLKMTREERRHSLAVRTEDVPRKLQSVHLMHGVASDKAVTFMEKVSWIVNSDDENFRRQMFGRISSCIGDKSAQWTEKLEDNFTILKALWNTFPEGQKPHGYETMEDIEKFERRMLEKQEPLSRQEQIIREMTATSPDKRMNLLRMFSMDMEYYLTNGPIHGYSDRNLSCGNFADQQAVMKALFESFPDDKKPEWITLDKIEGYKSRYNMRPPLKDGIYDVDVVLRKEYVGWAMDAWYKSLVNPTPGWLPAIKQIEVKDGRVVSFRGDYGLNQAPKIIGVNELTDNGLNVLYDVLRNENVREYAAMGDVINRMRDAGISIYPDRGLAYSRSSMSDEGRRMLDSGGRMYGFVRGDGTIFVDTNIATAETPIHEYTHLWAEVLRQQNPEEWKNIVMMMRDTPQWQQVRRDYPHLQLGDDIAEEALAHYSGVRGHQRLMESFGLKKDDGIEKLTDGQKGVFARVSEAIARFWSSVADFLHIHYTSKEQVADQILKDVMNRVNPLDFKKAMPEKVANGISRAHFIGEQGARNVSLGRQTFLPDLLKFAKDSAAQGMDPAKVKMITGWEQGVDGKWRYEVANTKVKNMEITDGTTLKDVIDAPAIFEAYPELKDIKVRIGSIAENANYNNETKTITLNEFYTKREVTKEQIQRIKAVNDQEIADSECKIAAGEDAPAQQARLQELLNVRAVLNGQIASSRSISDIWPDINNVFDHEVQHAIQHIEGFAVGGSLRTVADMRLATAQALMDKYEEVYNEYKDLEWRSQNEENLELAMDYYDAKTSFEQEHGAEIAAYLSARQQRDNAELDIVSGMLSDRNFEEYHRLAGEVEARNVARRGGMGVMERRRSLAVDTEDVPREEQVILKAGLAARFPELGEDLQLQEFVSDLRLSAEERLDLYEEVKGTHPDDVVLLRHDGVFETFGEDAITLASAVGVEPEPRYSVDGEHTYVHVTVPVAKVNGMMDDFDFNVRILDANDRNLGVAAGASLAAAAAQSEAAVENEKPYHIVIGEDNRPGGVEGEYHLQFKPDIMNVTFVEQEEIAKEFGGSMRVTDGQEWADFYREDDVVRFAEKIVGMNQERESARAVKVDPELREAREHLMDVISHALSQMNGHVEIEHTELPSVPIKGDWKDEGNGHVFMELIKGEHNVKDALFHDVHAETYTLDDVISKLDYSETYALTIAVREAQIKDVVQSFDGQGIRLDKPIVVSRDDNDTDKDYVTSVTFDDDGHLNISGHRVDAAGQPQVFHHADGLYLNGFDDLLAQLSMMREQKVEKKARENGIFSVDEILSHDDKFRYQLLSRMESDVKYFLGNGNRHVPDLWAGDVDKHIDLMFKLWDSFQEKPEWLSREQIAAYAEQMQQRPDAAVVSMAQGKLQDVLEEAHKVLGDHITIPATNVLVFGKTPEVIGYLDYDYDEKIFVCKKSINHTVAYNVSEAITDVGSIKALTDAVRVTVINAQQPQVEQKRELRQEVADLNAALQEIRSIVGTVIPIIPVRVDLGEGPETVSFIRAVKDDFLNDHSGHSILYGISDPKEISTLIEAVRASVRDQQETDREAAEKKAEQQKRETEQARRREEQKRQQEQKQKGADPAQRVAIQTALLVAALAASKDRQGLWLNAGCRNAPFFLPGTHLVMNPFNQVMMSLHADAGGYATGGYVTYESALKDGFSVRQGERSTLFVQVDKEERFENRLTGEQLGREQYDALPQELKELYRAVFSRQPQAVFNIDQTNMADERTEDYEYYCDHAVNKGAVDVPASVDEVIDHVHEQTPGSIVLVLQGDSYELRGQDATTAAALFGMDVRSVTDGQGNVVEPAVWKFDKRMLESYLPKIIEDGHHVSLVDGWYGSMDSYTVVNEAYDSIEHSARAMMATGMKVAYNSVVTTGYDKVTGQLNINSDRRSSYGESVPTAVGRVSDAARAMAASMVLPQYLNITGRTGILPSDEDRYRRLVQEVAAGTVLSRMGLPASLSEDNRRLVPYWTRELQTNPGLIVELENDVNSVVAVLDKITAGEQVDYARYRHSGYSMPNAKQYSISELLATYPDATSGTVVLVADADKKEVRVIVPDDVDGKGIDRNGILLPLDRAGYGHVSFYTAGGRSGLPEPNDFYVDKVVTLQRYQTSVTDGRTEYMLKPMQQLGLAEEIAHSHQADITLVDLIPGDNRKALLVMSDEGKAVTVYPTNVDAQLVESLKGSREDPRSQEILERIGRKYYDMVIEHPELERDLLTPKGVEIDMNQFSRVSIARDEQSPGKFLVYADIDGERQEPVSIDSFQAERFWLVGDRDMHKMLMLSELFRDKFGIAPVQEPAKQFIPKEQAAQQQALSADASREAGKEPAQQEVRPRGFHL